MRDEVIAKSNMRTGMQAADWQGAVRAAGSVLLEAGSIEPAYIDAMVAAVVELGPYMAIMPGLAIAHAAPGKFIKKNDVALINLAAPVRFGSDNDPIFVLLCLSCLDSKSHLDSMRRVAEVIAEDGVVEKLAAAKTADELYAIMHA